MPDIIMVSIGCILLLSREADDLQHPFANSDATTHMPKCVFHIVLNIRFINLMATFLFKSNNVLQTGKITLGKYLI